VDGIAAARKNMPLNRNGRRLDRSEAPMFSLLRLSALARCTGAAIVIAGLWGVVYWAMK